MFLIDFHFELGSHCPQDIIKTVLKKKRENYPPPLIFKGECFLYNALVCLLEVNHRAVPAGVQSLNTFDLVSVMRSPSLQFNIII